MNINNDTFYSSRKWKVCRARILRRDKYQCRNCRRYGRLTEATEVHHIKHLTDAPELAFNPDNLISLCHKCHLAAHPEKSIAGGKAARELVKF